MKFTDGYWLIKEGVCAHYAAQAYEAEISRASGETLVVYAPFRRVVHRGDVLNCGLLTLEYSSPLEDVVKVRITHFAGERPRNPSFDLESLGPTPALARVILPAGGVAAAANAAAASAGASGSAGQDPAEALFASGRLLVRVPLGSDSWKVEFLADGRLLTACDSKSTGFSQVAGDRSYMHEMLRLAPGECVYGLGERFTAFVKNGQSVDIWNRDGGTSSEQAYKNVPFYLTNRGYGVFVNHTGLVSFEVASEKVSRVQFSVAGESLEYYLIYGPTPKEILARYCRLTGRPALPPAWSFGLWLTTSFTTSYDEATVTSFIDGMAERNIPLSVFHFDCFWMKGFSWCDFAWDKRTFPDPEAMLRRLKERGLRVCVWINPYIAQRSALFAEGVAKGYLVRRRDGAVWQTDLWQAGMAFVDFTNPAACAWFAGKLKVLLDMGVDCFKTDFGERIPTEVVYHDGSDGERMHNYYSYLYNKTVFELLETERGRGEAVLFARSATAGGQRFPAHWGGDCESTYESMAESLRGGLSLALSGFGFWSHDIGGFEGMPRSDVYKRWAAFGLLSPLARLHGSSSYRVPWLFDQEAVDVLGRFTRLRNSLMPYLYQKAVEASRDALPMLRAMILEFPEDPACAYLDRQYMLGNALLVAPVFSADGDVDYYVPAGGWTNYFTGERVEGPSWRRETHGFQSLPLLVRPGALLPVGGRDDRPDYDYARGLRVEAYGIQTVSAAAVDIPDMRGNPADRVILRRSGRRIEVESTLSRWELVLVGVSAARAVSGARLAAGKRGAVVEALSTTVVLEILE